jgi:cell division protein FtsB
MPKHKLQQTIHPRILSAGQLPRPDNFFYRLFSSQRFLAIIGLVFLLLIVFPLAKTYTQRRVVEQEINGVKKEISDFESSNQEMRNMITYLQSDQSLEEQARLNLNLKKPGEKVIVIEEAKTSTSTIDINKNTTPGSNLTKWWHYFFD